MPNTFKIGQQVYSINTLNGGLVTNIEYQKNKNVELETICIITFTCDDTKKEVKIDSRFLTNDYQLVIKLCKEQIQEYKDAFFRQKNIVDTLKAAGTLG